MLRRFCSFYVKQAASPYTLMDDVRERIRHSAVPITELRPGREPGAPYSYYMHPGQEEARPEATVKAFTMIGWRRSRRRAAKNWTTLRELMDGLACWAARE